MLTFDLLISVTLDAAAAIKRDVAKSFPDIKSSHLTEAIARGLGYKTHASLLATADGSVSAEPVSGKRFSDFLRERGYDVDGGALYRAAARVAIRDVMAREPRLSRWGYSAGQPKRKLDGKWESATEHYARFLAEREQLLSDNVAEEFLRSLVLVQQVKQIKTINSRSGSYGLKHRAENMNSKYPDGAKLGPAYVANGSLIVAAVHAGFTYKTFLDDRGYDEINVAFNMSQTSLDDVLYRFLAARGLTDERARRAARRLSRRGEEAGEIHIATSII